MKKFSYFLLVLVLIGVGNFRVLFAEVERPIGGRKVVKVVDEVFAYERPLSVRSDLVAEVVRDEVRTSVVSVNGKEVKLVEIRPRNAGLPFLREASMGSGFEYGSDSNGAFNDGGSGNNGNGVNGGDNNGSNRGGVWKGDQDGYVGTEGACNFKDIAGDKNEWAIRELYARGMIRGRRPCYFEPNDFAARGEAASLSARILEKTGKVPAKIKALVKPFPDVEMNNGWVDDVNTAKFADVIHGYGDGNYRPEQAVNKVEALKIFSRTSDRDGIGGNLVLDGVLDIDLSQWYVRYVRDGVRDKVVEVVDGKLVPDLKLNRSEMALIALRFLLVD